MRYTTLFTTLLAAGEGAYAFGPGKGVKIVGSGRPRVPGAYIVEFTEAVSLRLKVNQLGKAEQFLQLCESYELFLKSSQLLGEELFPLTLYVIGYLQVLQPC